MSFREKSAWVTLISILLITFAYLTHAPRVLNPPPNFALHALVGAIILIVVLEIIGHIAIYLASPKEARTPKDERERLIDLKAVRISAYVYAVGSLAAIGTIALGANEVGIAHLIVLAFVFAEIVNYAARIVYYRRGF